MADIVVMRGPLFDGRAEAALHEYMRKMPEEIAKDGQHMVRDHLDSVLRQNRGVYTGRVHVRDEGQTQVILNDMVYSPWLEGISRRNQSTRFKGYHTFRVVSQQLDDRAESKAEEILRPYLAEMQ